MKYYIQNKDRGYIGNAIIFWAKDSCGYTANLDDAEQFEEEEAKNICLGNPEKNIAWSVDYIEKSKAVRKVVDMQYLEQSEIKNFK